MNYTFWRSIVLSFVFVLPLSLIGQNPVIFNIDCTNLEVGDTVCVPVTVEDFTDIVSFQGAINFNSNVIQVVDVDDINSCIPTTNLSFNFNNVGIGIVQVLWFDELTIPQSCPDGAELFSICFTAVGKPGECSPIFINDTGIEFIVEGADGDVPAEVNSCPNCITTNDLTIVSSYCEASPGGQDGFISFYATGGAGPYSYMVTHETNGMIAGGSLMNLEEWSMGNLPQGRYTIKVTDATGAMQTVIINITENFTIDFTLTGTDPTCWSRNNGIVEIGPISGGQNPYLRSWSSGQYNLDRITNLPVGTYTITVSDANGCEVEKSVELSVDTLKADYRIVDSIFCPGASDGLVWLKGSGGTPNNGSEYIYFLNGFRISFADSFLMTGTRLLEYNQLFVVDNAVPKCTSEVITFQMPYAHYMEITEELVQDVTCKGDANGRIRVTASVLNETNFLFRHEELPSGNIVPGGTGSTDLYFHNNLLPGDYRIAVESNIKKCKDTIYFTINEPDEALILNANVIEPSCTGNDGSITISPTGGVPGYFYNWGIPGDSTNMLDTLNGGDYKVVVTDANGCMDSLSFTLPVGGNLSVGAEILNALSCAGKSDGSLIANVSPPGPYNYQWTDENGMVVGSGPILNDVSAGWYYVEVTLPDCIAQDSVFLPDPTGMSFTEFIFTVPDCPGLNGSIGVVAEGGFPSYDYIWTKAGETFVLGTNSVLPSIQPGDYSVTITDQEGCNIDTTVTLDAPAAIDVDLSGIQQVDCFNEATGSATALASGGSQGATTFNYLWSSGEMTATATGLSPGTAWVIASDSKCASDTFYIDIPNAMPLTSEVSVLPVSCAEKCDGSITVIPGGGSGSGLQVFWPASGITSNTLSALCANNYDFIVMDDLGCEMMGTETIVAPDTLIAAINGSLTKNVSCRTNTGQIAIDVEGGNGGYQYTWTNDASDGPLGSDLTAGTYTILVTDSKNCTAEVVYTLEPTTAVTAVIPAPEEPACFGQTTCITVTSAGGGVGGPYSFQINQGPRFPIDSCVQVFAGQHKINVFDEAGCNLDTTIFIDQPSAVNVELGDDIEVNIGDETQEIVAIVTSELPIDLFTWSLLDSFECVFDDCERIIVTPVQDQMVTVYVEDANGCSDTDQLMIRVKDVRQVYFPNIFRPDGDGNNDFFQLSVGPGVERVDRLIIYDRWGNQLFVQTDYLPSANKDDGWDGEFNGRKVQPGVYVYLATVTFKDGRQLNYSGDLTIIR